MTLVVNKLKQLDTDKNGFIKQSAYNRKIVREAYTLFNPKNTEYTLGIEQYLSAMPLMDQANNKYFEFLQINFKPNAQFTSSLRREAISSLEQLLLNDGLESQIRTPLINLLNQNINSSARFTDLVTQVRDFIVGHENEGQLLRYSKQITSDALFNYSRAYQQAISSDLGLEDYEYSGGVTEGGKFSGGSRDFCLSRIGKRFKREEIESWASQSWTGKRRGTTSSSIFIYCGGYNCRHSLIPVINNENE